MRAIEMSEAQRSAALARHVRADEIMGDYEQQHSCKLPQLWRETIPQLLLNGMAEPELHRVFETIMRVEHGHGAA